MRTPGTLGVIELGDDGDMCGVDEVQVAGNTLDVELDLVLDPAKHRSGDLEVYENG